ncbi:hypothetical protein BDV18DRAFT_132197 [Aspergillus unguis]
MASTHQSKQAFNRRPTAPDIQSNADAAIARVYGSVSKGPVPHRYFYSHEGDPAITGPFQTEEEFGRAIALRSKRLWTEFDNPSFHSDFLARHLPVALCDHPIVFTHGDLHRENVVVRKIVGSDTEEEYEVAALVGWETAGWYPSYWEYAYIFPVLQWNDDWPEIVEKILDPFVLEGAMMSVVFRNMEF